MPHTDTPEGQTHSFNDGCGMPEHSCHCKEMTCQKDCARKHTHKILFCEICEPEASNAIYPPVTTPQPQEWEEVHTTTIAEKHNVQL